MASCGSCGTVLPDEARFCLSCGQAVATPACRECGADLVPGARFCMRCGTAVDEPQEEAPPQGRVSSRRVTSILFGDLVGFTTLSEARDQEDVRELLARYFDEASRIVGRYGGQVEKYIGDAVMAVWGVPVSQEDDAERAVRAGLELVSMVANLGSEVGVADLAMRVGVVTGEVAVTEGATGQGMVAGDPVNTASRVQSVAAPGQVWVDETTRLLTSAAITYGDAGTHQLKGKTDPMPLWSARAVVAAIGGAQRADGLEAPLVGRGRELRLVKELFHHSEESRQPMLLVVEGEPGVGKSRLGWEFEKYIDGLETTVRWHSGRCVAYGEGVAYFALAEAFRGRLLALADPDDEPEDAVLLDQGLDTYVDDAQEREWLRPRIGALLGIGSVGSYGREDLFSAWTMFLSSVGGGDPVVLLIDDAHHVDDGLLMFIEHLLDNAGFSCFVLMLSRTGLLAAYPGLVSRPQGNVVHLSALTGSDMGHMLDGLVDGLPDQVRSQLVARAEGVPLFAVETVRSLIDRDLVIPRGGRYMLADEARLDVDSLAPPASLHALLAARIDALTADQRWVLERASVLGTSFSPSALRWICPDVADVDGVLSELVRLQILSRETRRMSAELGDYRFVQTAVQQVAYGTLSRRDRKAIHLAVVAQFEADDPGDDTAAIRAQHYLDALRAVPEADDAGQLKAAAVENLQRAATRARDLGSPTESARHLAAAVDLTDERGTRARLLTQQAIAELDANDYEAAGEHARVAQEALLAEGDRVGAGLAVSVRGQVLVNGSHEAEAALELVEPWWEELRDRDDATDTLLRLVTVLMFALDASGQEVRDLAETRLRLAERSGVKGEVARSLMMLSVEYTNRGLLTLSDVLQKAAAELAREDHDLSVLAAALSNLTAAQAVNNVQRAAETGSEAAAAAERTGSPWLVDISHSNLELALWTAGDWGILGTAPVRGDVTRGAVRAMCSLARAVVWEPGTVSRTFGDRVTDSWMTFFDCLSALATGDESQALDSGREAVETTYGVSGVWDDLAHMWLPVFELALRCHDDSTITRMLQMCEEHSRQLPRGLRAEWAHARGLLAIRDGRDDEVEPALAEALEQYDAWGAVPYAARAKGVLARWLTERGRDEEAARWLRESRETLTSLGADAWLAELERPLLQPVGAD